MKQLTILVPAGDNNISSISGSYEIFKKANEHWRQRGNREIFDIELAGVAKTAAYSEGLFTVKPHRNISKIGKTDLIIIPSLNHNYQRSLKVNKDMIAWVENQYRHGAAVASICTGAFVLAASGLLDGRSCSTHWSVADHFRRMFPQVILQPEKVITDEQGIYTNGGAYSFLNLIIYLVEKYYDRETALFCAKVFQVEPDRNSQSSFSIFTGQKTHGDDMVMQAQEYIEERLHEKISVEHLSARFAAGRRNFDRRFIRATGNTPLEYAQRVKIESAKKAIEQGRKTINEIMYGVGYSDTKAFREVFRRITGLSPMEYRNRYKGEALSG